MDDRARETLELIQLAVQSLLVEGKISPADAGKQFVQVAGDFVEAGENELAWEALAQVPNGYFQDTLPGQRLADPYFEVVAAKVDEVFALAYFRSDVCGSA